MNNAYENKQLDFSIGRIHTGFIKQTSEEPKMSTLTTSLPGLGHSLFADAAHFVRSAFAAPKALPKPTPAAAVAAHAVAPSSSVDIWKLYRMSLSSDSVNPALFASLARD